MFNTLAVNIDGAIKRLELNQPDKPNPLSRLALSELNEAARWFDKQASVKVGWLRSGAGVFCGRRPQHFSGQPETIPAAADQGRLIWKHWSRCDGLYCGDSRLVCRRRFRLAAACDLRVAVESAKFSIPEVIRIPLAWVAFHASCGNRSVRPPTSWS